MTRRSPTIRASDPPTSDPSAPLYKRVTSGFRHGHRAVREDGRLESPTYTTWRAMIQRCYDKKHRSYEGYGEQGIRVAARWRKFENFLADMGTRPPGKTLGRLTPFSDYGPGECEWQTISQQNLGLKSHADHMVKVQGVSRTKRAWARLLRIKYATLLWRIRHGWGESAFTTPAGKRRGWVEPIQIKSRKARSK